MYGSKVISLLELNQPMNHKPEFPALSLIYLPLLCALKKTPNALA
jgi:hypothetical protein